MALKYRCKNPLKLVSDEEIQNIHQNTLQVLEEVGLCFEDQEALNLLADNGCIVNRDKMIAKIPSSVVEESLQKCPREAILHARNPEHDIRFDTETVQFGPCCGMKIMDLETGRLRPGTLKDAGETARLTDALDIMSGTNIGLGFLADKPREINLVWQYATAFRNSQKVFSLGAMDDSIKWGIRMAQVVGQDVIVPASSNSPLGWSAEQIDAVKRATAAGMAITPQSMASPGITAPATMAGTAVVMNAEILGIIVLAQLLRPGTGVIYSCFTIPMDMRTATLASGSMEMAMLTVISAQLSRLYGIGNMVWAPMSDSKQFDEQAGYEKAMQWLLAAMAGINLIWGAGMVENHAIWSNAQLIIDAEMCGMVGRYLEGVGVTDDTMALSVIKSVGHFPNNYLAHDHTFKWFKKEQYMPLVSSREDYDGWMESGGKDLLARGDEIARSLLEKHEPVPLPAEMDRELDRLLHAVAKEKGLKESEKGETDDVPG